MRIVKAPSSTAHPYSRTRLSGLRYTPTSPVMLRKGNSTAELLPFEIIAEILWNVVSVWTSPTQDELRYLFLSYREDVAAFKAAIATCQTWRHVALNCPAIWGYVVDVDNSPTAWVEGALLRSRSHPFFILSTMKTTPYVHRLEYSWNAILEEFNRLRSLAITSSVHWRQHLLNKIFKTAAPRLEFIDIKMPGGSQYNWLDPVSLPLFKLNAPKLLYFHSEGCALNYARHVPIGVNLTYLGVFHSADPLRGDNQGLCSSDWLTIMALMPHLETVYLKNCIHANGRAVRDSITLSNLKSVYLMGDASMTELLDNLIAPASCHFRINAMQLNMMSGCALATALTKIFKRWEDAADPPRLWEIDFKGAVSQFSLAVPERMECTLGGLINDSHDMSRDLLSAYLEAFVKHAPGPVRNLQGLTLQLGIGNDALDLSKPLGNFISCCSAVQVLRLSSTVGFPIFQFLQMAWQTRKSETDDMIWTYLLPSLTTVVVSEGMAERCDVAFKNYRKWRRAQSLTNVNIKYIGRLRTWNSLRRLMCTV